MVKNNRNHLTRIAVVSLLMVSVPMLIGQGCPGFGAGGIQPLDPRPITDPSGSGIPGFDGNYSPIFRFTYPMTDVAGEVGNVIDITWTDDDPDNNAAITILLDPDNIFGNGNEVIVLPVVLEDDPTDSFLLDTGAFNLKPTTYRIIARVNDGVNPEIVEVAVGRLLLFGAGLLPANISPSISVLEPTTNIGVSQNDSVDIRYCGQDPDDSSDGSIVPDVILLLDYDNDPINDIDLTGPDAENTILDICFSGLPRNIGGAIVIGCFKDDDCQATMQVPLLDDNGNPVTDSQGNPVMQTVPNPGSLFTLNIDVGLIPPRESGDPYYIRATMWDHTNPAVHSYAMGNISITAYGSGTVDLGRLVER
ncbi:MAG: hypothetical protein JSV03_17070 [Planctomycetota bacterium]|nr:MAG: hypothetical protein JSV03_17070 [Planctomycetota bacterium]